jgi:long-chain acyl-CoA synthetase
MNLASILAEAVAAEPDKVAFKLDDVELTYHALDEASARVAGLLRAAGVGPGDRVGIMLPNVPYFPVAYYGVLRLGAVVVPMNVLLKGREVRYYLEDPGAKALIAWNGFEEAAREGAEGLPLETFIVTPGEFEQQLGGVAEPVREIADRGEDDTAVILYTSGTTGSPKGAELTHSNMLTNCRVVTESVIVIEASDRLLGALPLFHSFGQTCTMNAAINARATVSLIPRFDPVKAFEILERDQITIFEGVPTMYTALLAVPDRDRYDTSSLRVCVSGGASLPVETLRAFESEFGVKLLEGYGLSETSPVASFNHPHMEQKAGSIGTPIEGVEMKAIDDDGNEVAQGEPGEIAIRGHNVMKGYWDRPDATAEAIDGDGWFKTGDVATVDEEGYFFIVDRKKDMIIRGGYNVYPREIEEVLYGHPAVLEAAVVGVPHGELGEEVGAAVVLNEGAEASAEEIREHCKAEVAAYKYPRHVWFLDELPKGPTGKILKREIETPQLGT